MRVLMALHHLTFGGIEVMLLRSIPIFQEQGVHLDFCLTGPAAMQDDMARHYGCGIHRIPRFAVPGKTARAVSRLVKEYKYDIVHSHFAYTSGGFVLGAQQAGVKSLVSLHASEATSLRQWRKRPVLRQVREGWLWWHRQLIDRYADKVVGHSCSSLDAFQPGWREDEERYRLVMNGIYWPKAMATREEARRWLGIEDDETVLLHVGSFRALKNHEGVLEVFSRVLEERPSAQLILVGDGTRREAIAQRAIELGIADQVRFEGMRTDPWPYYRAADLLVFPSETEGFANVLVEAQGAGLPVVASDIPAHRESVHPALQQCLFPLPDYDIAKEKAMRCLEEIQPEKNIASDMVQRFSIDRFAGQLADLYSDMV